MNNFTDATRKWGSNSVQNIQEDINYLIQFTTSPGDAIFEGVVLQDVEGARRVKYISRINKYSHMMTCDPTSNGFRPHYCICKNYLSGERKAQANLIFEEYPKDSTKTSKTANR